MAVVGRVSNEEHSSQHIGSAQRLRWLGFRPRSGLWHRKDGRYLEILLFNILKDFNYRSFIFIIGMEEKYVPFPRLKSLMNREKQLISRYQ